MPRAPQPWFRFYVEALRDPKIRRLAPAHRWVWAAVLGAARESPFPGELMISERAPMTIEEIADLAAVKVSEARKAIADMERIGLIEVGSPLGEDVIVVPKFRNRQFESDNVAARTKKHRERSNEQHRNVPTDQRRNVPTTAVGTSFSRARPTETENRDNSPTSEGSPNVPAGALPQVITAYVRSGRDAGVPTPEASQDRVQRSAARLLAEGYPLTTVIDAARNAAVGGWTDLATQLQRDASRASPATNGTTSTADQRFQAGLNLADQLDRKALG